MSNHGVLTDFEKCDDLTLQEIKKMLGLMDEAISLKEKRERALWSYVYKNKKLKKRDSDKTISSQN
jgi:hypothetical protein